MEKVNKTISTKGKRLDIRLDNETLDTFRKASNSIGLTAPQMVRMFIEVTNNDYRLKLNSKEIKVNENS